MNVFVFNLRMIQDAAEAFAPDVTFADVRMPVEVRPELHPGVVRV